MVRWRVGSLAEALWGAAWAVPIGAALATVWRVGSYSQVSAVTTVLDLLRAYCSGHSHQDMVQGEPRDLRTRRRPPARGRACQVDMLIVPAICGISARGVWYPGQPPVSVCCL